ncbi:DUF1127 domain-containing protein [Halomonas sp. M20]|uniref:DUF1127 domain-containing protein n=1 Tax=Halomonas sp. M20 TaxID=2763264 RepID=UPI001D09E3BA|nr:DUF1127 domain-containing protein [Halomonas sp. M20]
MTLTRLTRLFARLREYQHRRYSRQQLLELELHQLKDIGLSRADAVREGSKPFWKA